LPGQIASTCPAGRDVTVAGYPVRVVELLSALATPGYIARVAVNSPRGIVHAKNAVRKAFKYQAEGRCFSLIEFVSTCPTNWGMSPQKALDWAESDMLPYYLLGEYKTPDDPLPPGLKLTITGGEKK
ncbi:MAG: hypothetical protein ABIC40_07640, partial [bacterium]